MSNIEAFLQEDVDYVIASCATGSAHLKDYKRLFQSDTRAQTFSSKVRDISEFLANEASYAKRLRDKSFSSREKTARVTYHDPCHLRRRQKIFKEPRSLVQAIQGIEFVEMNHPERCCGHGGSFHFDHHDLSLNILTHKIDDIRETNADIVATGCMACLLQLMEGIDLHGLNIKVMHIAQLIDQHCLNPQYSES
jgi:glycolate oxidase iron-sulfur subunit